MKIYLNKNENNQLVRTQLVGNTKIEDIIGEDVLYKVVDLEAFKGIDRAFMKCVDTDFSKLDDNKVTVDLDLAKEAMKASLRIERKPLLEAQDILFMQAQESGADTKAIVAEKVRLRDITKEVDSCKTTDELKALKCEAS